MTPIEWGILAIVAAGALIGLVRGFVRGVVDLLALVLGAASAIYSAQWIDERLVGYGVDSRILLIVIVVSLAGMVAAASGLVLRFITAPLGLARAIPPFGWLDRLFGIVPGLVKGGLSAVLLVAVVLVQFPGTAVGAELRSSDLGNRLAQAGSIGYERATSWAGKDLLALAKRDIEPGQTWTGLAALPSGNLRPDSDLETAAWRLINDAGERQGLPALRPDDDLITIARDHALDARGAENHRLSSSVEDVGDRLAGDSRNCLAIGAVLATGETASELVESLMASEKHRDVLLSNSYVYAGVGVVSGASGEAILVGVFVY